MRFDEWWNEKVNAIEGASPGLLKALYENAWWTGHNHVLRKEKDYAFDQSGNQKRVSLPVIDDFCKYLDSVFVSASQADTGRRIGDAAGPSCAEKGFASGHRAETKP